MESQETACTTDVYSFTLRCLVCFSAALFPFYDFIQMTMFNAISADLMKAFKLSAYSLGNVSAFYLYATLIVIFPAGILLDRFSPRKILLIALSISLSGTLIFSLATHIVEAEAGRFIAGIGGSFSFLTVFILVARWFSAARRATIIGLVITMAMLGGIMAQVPLTLLVDKLGWRQVLWSDIALGIVILSIIWRNVQDYPPGFTPSYTHLHQQQGVLAWKKCMLFALKSRQTWLCAGYTALLNLPLLLLGAVWGNSYLTTVHHLTRPQASYVTSMIFVGTILGAAFFGWWSDYLRVRRLPMLTGAVVSLGMMLTILLLPGLTLISLFILFLLLGMSTSSQVISYPVIAESNSPLLTGACEGIAAVIIMSGGAIFQPLFGWLIEKPVLHDSFLRGGDTALNYKTAMLIFPVAFLIALIFAYAIKETYCKPLT